MNEQQIRTIFKSLDTNGDGRISKEELRQGLRHLHIPYSHSSIEKFMEAVDVNHDGYISFEEFHAAVLTQQERLKRAFRELDHGGDDKIGALDLEKFSLRMGIHLSHDEIKQLLEKLDRNNSGHVEVDEFCEYFLTQMGDTHPEGLFESWMKSSAISSIAIPDVPQENIPSWITLVSGAMAGITSRTLTAPADRIKTLLQACDAQKQQHSSQRAFGGNMMQAGNRDGGINMAASLRNFSSLSSLPSSAPSAAAVLQVEYPTRKQSNGHAPLTAGRGVLGSLSHASRAVTSIPMHAPGRLQLGLIPDEEGFHQQRRAAAPPPPPQRPAPLQVHSIRQGIRAILADGGVKAFWRGNGINVMKVAPETAAKFWAYEHFKALLCEDPNNITIQERFLAGASAGAVSQAAIYPLEVAKTRFALSVRGQYRSIGHCMASCVRKEGPFALYRGLLASLMGMIPYSGVDLGLYSLLKDSYKAHFPHQEPGVLTLLACGATATTCAQVVSYPMQLVRTRLQAQGMEGRPVVYTGVLDCLRKTVAAEGWRGLYRGILPNFMKSVPAMAISYATYETTKRSLVVLWNADRHTQLFM